MGWNFRRTFRSGPFRVNISKSGIGYSVGSPFLRVGKGPRGTRISSSISGTGIYYRKEYTSGSTGQKGWIAKHWTLDDLSDSELEEERKTVALLWGVFQVLGLLTAMVFLGGRVYFLNPEVVAIAGLLALTPTTFLGSHYLRILVKQRGLVHPNMAVANVISRSLGAVFYITAIVALAVFWAVLILALLLFLGALSAPGKRGRS